MFTKPELLISNVEDAEWDDLVQQFPARTVFHSMAWLTALCDEHRLRRTLVRADVDGRCVALWPCLEMRKGPFRIIGSPLPGWSTAYLGPLFADEIDPTHALAAFLRVPPLKRWSYFRLRVLDEGRRIDLHPFGFQHIAREETYLLNVQSSEEDLWNNLKAECRTRIRKAEKLGVTIEQELDNEFMDEFWRMSCEVFAKSNLKPPFTLSLVERLVEQLRRTNQIQVLSAKMDGRRIATLVLPHNDHTMYYWAGGSYQEFRDVPANNLLHWSAILQARSMGLRTYDFISTVGGPGRFKKTFGPEARIVATHWEASRHRLIGALKNRYEGYLRSRRMLKV